MATLKPLSVSSAKYDEIAGRVRASFPNSCILWIDEVSNSELEREHESLFDEIQKKRVGVVVTKEELFHGTTERAVNAICNEGFKTEYNTVSAYGRGTYFAKNASYSFSYSKKSLSYGKEIVYMMLCSVIVGMSQRGTNNGIIDTMNVDTNVDNLADPNIFVSPYDKGGIPKYVIAFHTNPSM
jgi:hypothetical protein